LKLPDKVKVGGYWYKVLFPYVFTERTDSHAQTCHGSLEIRIKDRDLGGGKLADARIQEIFFHEILHGLNEVYNASGLDEDTIERLGQGLYQFLSDNGYLKE